MTGKITYKDEKDGLTYEWDEGKKAWLPALGEDFMAMYQLNYGFTKYVISPSPYRQCCGSGSGFNGVPGSVSGFAIRIQGGQKWPTNIEKKQINFIL